ncbi:hypothetical protein HNR46_000085 [Haloferula luteola]|uniref:Uncharacterized protein n=1 Tax=Haloferula luteola TaxID=595692 RepID=A0A840V2H3_9BACT|nr:hypothetical protein [Haloferula luteola]MBB5349864.1 hypothetical protein [Haloferula luteola]
MPIALVGFPLGLVIFTGLAWWKWHARGPEVEELHAFTLPITLEGLAADRRKIEEFAAPRYAGDVQAEQGLKSMAAMIDGTLGPENAGYRMELLPGPGNSGENWPIIIAHAEAQDGSKPPLWIVTPYDTDPSRPDHSAVETTLAVAGGMAGQQFKRSLSFAFLPHGQQLGPQAEETRTKLQKRIGENARVMWIEAVSWPSLLEGSRHNPSLSQWLSKEVGLVAGEATDSSSSSSWIDFKLTRGSQDEDTPENRYRAALTVADLIRFLATQ